MDFHCGEQFSSVAGLELIKAKCAIEQFIYSCSHSLRGPLKSISGLVYLLKNSGETVSEEQHLFFQSIENTVGKMEKVLSELEKFLSNSRLHLSAQPIKLETMISDQLLEMAPAISEKKINVVVSVEQPVPFHTDENRFNIVMTQLISNAIQFCDANKPIRKLSIGVKVTAHDCHLRVFDNGIGIGEDILPNIFNLFYRGSVQSTGAGVGLYIVKDVIDALGGTITVQSVEGQGASVLFVIPNLSALDGPATILATK